MTQALPHFVDKGPIVKRQAFRTLVQTMLINGTIELVHNTSAPGSSAKKSGGWRPVIDLSSLNALLELPHFTMETAESIRRSPAGRLVHTNRSGGCILPHPNPLPNTMGFHQGYDGGQSVCAWHGHQPMSVPGRLADILDISRSLSPRHRSGAPTLPRNGPVDSLEEVRLDSHTEFHLSGVSIRPNFFPSDSDINPAQAGGTGPYVADAVCLFAATEKLVPLGRLQLLLMCQQEGIASRARHIPGKLNVLADVLSHPTQMSGTE